MCHPIPKSRAFALVTASGFPCLPRAAARNSVRWRYNKHGGDFPIERVFCVLAVSQCWLLAGRTY